MEVWPNFFIVGAPKAATTSFYYYLNRIPKIFMSPVKEPNYFSTNLMLDDYTAKPIRDKQKYLSLFKKVKNEKIIGEASTLYLSDPKAPKLIHQVAPLARIIIILRDPIERIYSEYLMLVRLGQSKLSFHKELQKVLGKNYEETNPKFSLYSGLYTASLKRYLDIFGINQVKIIIFEEFVKHPKETVTDTLRFLNVDSHLNDFKGELHNQYAIPRGVISQYILKSETVKLITGKIIPKSLRTFTRENFLVKKQSKEEMDSKDKETLIKFYKDDVKQLQIILKRKLTWKNFLDTV